MFLLSGAIIFFFIWNDAWKSADDLLLCWMICGYLIPWLKIWHSPEGVMRSPAPRIESETDALISNKQSRVHITTTTRHCAKMRWKKSSYWEFLKAKFSTRIKIYLQCIKFPNNQQPHCIPCQFSHFIQNRRLVSSEQVNIVQDVVRTFSNERLFFVII